MTGTVFGLHNMSMARAVFGLHIMSMARTVFGLHNMFIAVLAMNKVVDL